MSASKLLLAAAAAISLSACNQPTSITQSPMSAAYEVPAKNSPGTGTVLTTYYPSTRALTYTVTYKDLTGPATAAHIHGPAAMGANAPVIFPAASTTSPITGGATLTEAQAADFMANKYYFNIHTATNPGGEIRGQMMAAPR